MSDNDANRRKPVVLRHVDDWDELSGQITADRAVGLSPSPVRDALATWYDPGSFSEVGTLVRRATTSYRGGDVLDDGPRTVPVDGLVAGWGHRRGQLVFVAADDPTLGSPWRGSAGASKAGRVRQHALAQSAPILAILGAGRIDPDTFIGAEFVRFGYGVDLDFEVEAEERILKLAIVTHPVSAQAAMEAAWCHLVVLAGPDAAIDGRSGDRALAAGLADAACPDLGLALDLVGGLLDHIPGSRFGPLPAPPRPTPGLPDGLPDRLSDGGRPAPIFDRGWVQALWPGWQTTVRTALGTVGGHPAGLVELEPGAVLTAPAAGKATRLARLCATFGLPLILSHAGWALPDHPTRADVGAWDQLGRELARGPLVEVARPDPGIRAAWSVRPIWCVSVGSSGPSAPSASGPGRDRGPGGVDAVVTADDVGPALAEVLGQLTPRRPRPQDDPRIAATPARRLQSN